MIYLDNAATTPLDRKAGEIMLKYSCDLFYNPSAIYKQAVSLQRDIDSAKESIAKALGTTFNNNIIFTSSATEANNLAIHGAYRKGFKKMIFSVGEHPAVYNTALSLEKQGVTVEFVGLQPNGEIDYSELESKLDETVSYISIMASSNETGAINDLRRISELRNKYCPKAIFHSDGVQSFGKMKLNVDYFGVDMFTICAHKAFGPKGIAALYVKDKNLLNPIIHGGGQEYGFRSGTENIAGVMAFKYAVDNIGNIKENLNHVQSCFDAFINEIDMTNVKLNSHHSPYVLSLSFKGVNGETLVHMMEDKDILISRGSACSSKKAGNRILESMGLTTEEILGSVRISFSKLNTIEECAFAGKTLHKCYAELKEKLK